MPRLGVLGWPVAHSRSPAMHNAALRELGLVIWRYQRLPVPPSLFAQTVSALGPARLHRGANVTIPHKVAALELASRPARPHVRSERRTRSRLRRSGGIEADNTDAPGLIAALDCPLEGLRVLVLGAGGARAPAAWALREGERPRCRYGIAPPWRARGAGGGAGRPHAEQVERPICSSTAPRSACARGERGAAFALLGLDEERMSDYGYVADLAYRSGRPSCSRRRAAGRAHAGRTRGARRPGRAQLRAWTGRAAPIEVMRRAARGAAGARRAGGAGARDRRSYIRPVG